MVDPDVQKFYRRRLFHYPRWPHNCWYCWVKKVMLFSKIHGRLKSACPSSVSDPGWNWIYLREHITTERFIDQFIANHTGMAPEILCSHSPEVCPLIKQSIHILVEVLKGFCSRISEVIWWPTVLGTVFLVGIACVRINLVRTTR